LTIPSDELASAVFGAGTFAASSVGVSVGTTDCGSAEFCAFATTGNTTKARTRNLTKGLLTSASTGKCQPINQMKQTASFSLSAVAIKKNGQGIFPARPIAACYVKLQFHSDRLHFRVVRQAILAQLPPDAGLLESAKRRSRVKYVVAVY